MSKPILLITGGGRGIGAATAKLAARQGYRVVINYRKDATSAEQVIADILASGGLAHCIQADISDAEQVTKLFDRIHQTWGAISALVNNAGVLETQMTFVETDLNRWKRIFETMSSGRCCAAKQPLSTWQSANMVQAGALLMSLLLLLCTALQMSMWIMPRAKGR